MAERPSTLRPGVQHVEPDHMETLPVNALKSRAIEDALAREDLENRVDITTNFYARQTRLTLQDQEANENVHVVHLSDFDKRRDQGYVRISSGSEILAVKCIATTKHDRRRRRVSDEKLHRVAALDVFDKRKDPTRDHIWEQVAHSNNHDAWDDYEVRNFTRYIREGHENVLSLHGFASVVDDFDIKKETIMLFYEYCNAGTLLDYTKNCYDKRLLAHEVFISDHVAGQLASAIAWLHNDNSTLVRPQLLHRNIRPENCFLKLNSNAQFPDVRLGGFENLTPIFKDTEINDKYRNRSPWDCPDFPLQTKKTDFWSLGVVLYTTLTFGHYPPIDGIVGTADFMEEPIMHEYTSFTFELLHGLLHSSRQNSWSAGEVLAHINRSKGDLIRGSRQRPWSLEHPEDRNLVCEPLVDIVEYRDELQRQIEEILQGLFDLACQTQIDLDKKEDLLSLDGRFSREIDDIFAGYFPKDKRQNNETILIENEIKILVDNIRYAIKIKSEIFWKTTRARFLCIKPSLRGRKLRPEGDLTRIVINTAEDIVAGLEPLIGDIFWRVARKWSRPMLSDYPTSKLFKPGDLDYEKSQLSLLDFEDNQRPESGAPLILELAEALQLWLVEHFFRGLYDSCRILQNQDQADDIQQQCAERITELYETWPKHETSDAWLAMVDNDFPISYSRARRTFSDRYDPPGDVELRFLHGVAETFARSLVPISTRYLRVPHVENKRPTLQTMVGYLRDVQSSWQDSTELYPDLDGPNIAGNTPPGLPSIYDLAKYSESDALDIMDTLRAALYQSTVDWIEVMSDFREEYKEACDKFEDLVPDEAFLTRMQTRSYQVAKAITADFNDMLEEEEHFAQAEALMLEAARSSIYEILRDHHGKRLNTQRLLVQERIVESLFPYIYAVRLYSAEMTEFFRSYSVHFMSSCVWFENRKTGSNAEAYMKKYTEFEELLNDSLGKFFHCLGHPLPTEGDGLKHPHTKKVKKILKAFEANFTTWFKTSDRLSKETIMDLAEGFVSECRRILDRERAAYLDKLVAQIKLMTEQLPRKTIEQLTKEHSTTPFQPAASGSHSKGAIKTGPFVPQYYAPQLTAANLKQIPAEKKSPQADKTADDNAKPAKSSDATSFGWSDAGRDDGVTFPPHSNNGQPPRPPLSDGPPRSNGNSLPGQQIRSGGKGKSPSIGMIEPRQLMADIKVPVTPAEVAAHAKRWAEAHSAAPLRIRSLSDHNKLLTAEILRSVANLPPGRALPWQAQRTYGNTGNSGHKKISVIGPDSTVVATRSWMSKSPITRSDILKAGIRPIHPAQPKYDNDNADDDDDDGDDPFDDKGLPPTRAGFTTPLTRQQPEGQAFRPDSIVISSGKSKTQSPKKSPIVKSESRSTSKFVDRDPVMPAEERTAARPTPKVKSEPRSTGKSGGSSSVLFLETRIRDQAVQRNTQEPRDGGRSSSLVIFEDNSDVVILDQPPPKSSKKRPSPDDHDEPAKRARTWRDLPSGRASRIGIAAALDQMSGIGDALAVISRNWVVAVDALRAALLQGSPGTPGGSPRAPAISPISSRGRQQVANNQKRADLPRRHYPGRPMTPKNAAGKTRRPRDDSYEHYLPSDATRSGDQNIVRAIGEFQARQDNRGQAAVLDPRYHPNTVRALNSGDSFVQPLVEDPMEDPFYHPITQASLPNLLATHNSQPTGYSLPRPPHLPYPPRGTKRPRGANAGDHDNDDNDYKPLKRQKTPPRSNKPYPPDVQRFLNRAGPSQAPKSPARGILKSTSSTSEESSSHRNAREGRTMISATNAGSPFRTTRRRTVSWADENEDPANAATQAQAYVRKAGDPSQRITQRDNSQPWRQHQQNIPPHLHQGDSDGLMRYIPRSNQFAVQRPEAADGFDDRPLSDDEQFTHVDARYTTPENNTRAGIAQQPPATHITISSTRTQSTQLPTPIRPPEQRLPDYEDYNDDDDRTESVELPSQQIYAPPNSRPPTTSPLPSINRRLTSNTRNRVENIANNGHSGFNTTRPERRVMTPPEQWRVARSPEDAERTIDELHMRSAQVSQAMQLVSSRSHISQEEEQRLGEMTALWLEMRYRIRETRRVWPEAGGQYGSEDEDDDEEDYDDVVDIDEEGGDETNVGHRVYSHTYAPAQPQVDTQDDNVQVSFVGHYLPQGQDSSWQDTSQADLRAQFGPLYQQSGQGNIQHIEEHRTLYDDQHVDEQTQQEQQQPPSRQQSRKQSSERAQSVASRGVVKLGESPGSQETEEDEETRRERLLIRTGGRLKSSS